MSDADIRTLERRVREGGDDLDHARLFSALWKRGEADLYVFVMSMVYEEPQVRFEIVTKTRPEGLRVPVLISMKKLDIRLPYSWSVPSLHLDVSTRSPPQKAVDVKWHACWDTSGGWDPGYTIKSVSSETIWATVRNESPDVSKAWTFFPMVRPAEVPR